MGYWKRALGEGKTEGQVNFGLELTADEGALAACNVDRHLTHQNTDLS